MRCFTAWFRFRVRLGARLGLALLALCATLALSGGAHAHETTRSYLTLQRSGDALSAQFRVAFRDIEVAVWMDQDLDGQITWGEVTQRQDAVLSYIKAGISLDAGGACALDLDRIDTSRTGGLAYLDLALSGRCPQADAPLDIRSRLFFDIDPDHRMFLSAQIDGTTTTTLLSRSDPQTRLSIDSGGPLAAFWRYFRAGVEHLLAGADHIAFLLVLMLPAICRPQGETRKAAVEVLTAITGFTLAHAMTLTAATTDLLHPPSDLITILIALSIVVTALDNIHPFIPASRAAVAAFFGIIHGFGFATALGALHLSGGGVVVALLGFNIGIEAAQVGLVLITMPALYMLRGGRVLLWIGSSSAGILGLYWIWQRLTLLIG